jgi:hypothetical protein
MTSLEQMLDEFRHKPDEGSHFRYNLDVGCHPADAL